jgi:hypothetical protein
MSYRRRRKYYDEINTYKLLSNFHSKIELEDPVRRNQIYGVGISETDAMLLHVQFFS